MPKAELKRLQRLLDLNSQIKQTQFDRKLIKQYKIAYDYVKKELNNIFNRFGTQADYSQISAPLRNLELELSKRIQNLIQISNTTIQNGIKELYVFNYNELTSIVQTAIQPSVSFGIIDDKAVATNLLNQYNWQQKNIIYTGRVLSGVRDAVSQGLLTGQSFDKIISNATNSVNIAANNASRIIRTEMHRAESISRLDSMNNTERIAESLGYKQVRIWNSFIDNRTRQEHIDADGQESDSDGYFLVAGERIQYPGDGSPYNSINCRCSVVIELR